MNRIELINKFIDHFEFAKYLEIGYNKGSCFESIECDNKTAVDPILDDRVAYRGVTSDEFFDENRDVFDLIFIDGLHHKEQFKRDVTNSLEHLSDRGVIVCHDCAPKHKERTTVPRETAQWNGDVYKGWIELRKKFSDSREDMEMFVIPRDEGCGVITRGNNPIMGSNYNVSVNPLTLPLPRNWEEYMNKRKEYLGLLDNYNELKKKLQ